MQFLHNLTTMRAVILKHAETAGNYEALVKVAKAEHERNEAA